MGETQCGHYHSYYLADGNSLGRQSIACWSYSFSTKEEKLSNSCDDAAVMRALHNKSVSAKCLQLCPLSLIVSALKLVGAGTNLAVLELSLHREVW